MKFRFNSYHLNKDEKLILNNIWEEEENEETMIENQNNEYDYSKDKLQSAVPNIIIFRKVLNGGKLFYFYYSC